MDSEKIVGQLEGNSFLIALSGIVIVFIMLALLAVLVLLMSRIVRSFSKETPATAVKSQSEIVMPTLSTFELPAQIELTDVDDLIAACIIAIVSDEMGVSPDDLIFKSIKAL